MGAIVVKFIEETFPKPEKLDCQYGSLVQREWVESRCPFVMAEWDNWLDAQADPGNYDYFKVVLNGEVIFISETFMPGFICQKVKDQLCP